MQKYKVVFCGTPTIGAQILQALLEMENVQVELVISQPDRPVGRKKIISPTPVKILALKNQLKIVQPEKIATEFATIQAINPDFLITCAYGQFIPTKILALPKIEALNVHGSLLPQYRGGAPIQHAIWNGESQTGVSIMRMVAKMDAGPYFVQKAIPIAPTDTSGDLFAKVGAVGAKLIKKTLPLIATKALDPIVQDENAVSFAYNLTPSEEKIDWQQPAEKIYNQIRAFNPHPIAYTTLQKERYKIHQARLLTPKDVFPMVLKIFFPGEIIRVDKEGIVVQTGQGMLKILTLQKQGKNVTNAGVFGMNHFHTGVCFDQD